jgi:tetratricopeptide (TPR) repeat protein
MLIGSLRRFVGPALGLAILGGTAVLAGCRDGSSPDATGNDSHAVTWAKHVAPIVFDRCTYCHSPGGSAPFGLLDYQSVRSRARLIAALTRDRIMPPWLPEPGHGEFAGDRSLTAAQIDTIQRWVEQGALEGDDADRPPVPERIEGWRLGKPDLIVKMPQPYTLPAAGSDVWRNFVIPIPVSRTHFVRTVELQPGSARFVHHALFGVDGMRTSSRRDAQDAEVGFEGMEMGDAEMPDGALLGWTPGMLPFPGIEGTAWRLDPGTDAVLQLHMVPSGKPEVIEATVALYFAKTSDMQLPAYVLQLDADDQIDIPAGDKEFVVTDTLELPVDVDLYTVYPHAHYIGRSVAGSATFPDGTTRSLLRIDRWDFKWQDIYRYSKPLFLPRGTTVSMRWIFDNSAENPRQVNHPPMRVKAGNRSSDEMAHLMLQMRPRRPQDLHVLKEAHLRHLVRRNPRNARFRWGLAGTLKDQGRFPEAAVEYRAALASDPAHVSSHINLGAVLMMLRQEQEAIRHFLDAVRIDPDSAGAHYNLGFAFASVGQLDNAVRHYREALRIQPGYAEAHNNVGQLLIGLGRVPEGISHLREAARLLPDSAEVHNNLGVGLLRQGNVEEAIRHFQSALAIDPRHADARQNLGAAMTKSAAAPPSVR